MNGWNTKTSHGGLEDDVPFQLGDNLGGGNSNIFYFHPYLGKISHFDSYFSKGLKPPSSNDL